MAAERTYQNPLDDPRVVIGERRSDGLIEVRTPLQLIDREEVPIQGKHVEGLFKLMRGHRLSYGGNGQIAATELAQMPGNPRFRIADGFHRDRALEMLMQSLGLNSYEEIAIVRPNCTEETLLDRRIAATTHESVVFARSVGWVRQVWGFSGLQDKLSVEQAFALFLGKFDPPPPIGLDDETISDIQGWVAGKCEVWEREPNDIFGHLKPAIGASPKLIQETRGRGRGGGDSHKPSPTHVDFITTHLRGMPAHQEIVQEAIADRGLPSYQAGELAQAIKGVGIERAKEIAKGDNWAPKPVLPEAERIRSEADKVAVELLINIRKVLANWLDRENYSVPLTPETLLAGNPGLVWDEMRKWITPQGDTKKTPQGVVLDSERLLTNIDFRGIRELAGSSSKRDAQARRFMEELGFTTHSPEWRTPIRTDRHGHNWQNFNHPFRPMSARTYGSIWGDELRVDGYYLVFSERHELIEKKPFQPKNGDNHEEDDISEE